MQRWIIAGVVLLVFTLGVGFIGIRVYKQNRPYPVWVPLPVNPELSGDKKLQFSKELKQKLGEHQYLLSLSKELELAKKWKLASNEEAADLVAARLFVKVGEADTPKGTKIPSINIGVNGKAKDKDVSNEIALRLHSDVRKILGADQER